MAKRPPCGNSGASDSLPGSIVVKLRLVVKIQGGIGPPPNGGSHAQDDVVFSFGAAGGWSTGCPALGL